jgi:hypothetical protein
MSKSSEQGVSAQEKWSGRLANTKTSLDMIRQVLIVLVLALFILWPTALKSSLAELGFKKVNIAGAELEIAQNASEKTGDAVQRLGETTKNIDSVKEQLKSLAERTDNPEIKSEIVKLDSTLQQSLDTTKNAEQKLNASLSAQTSIIQNAAPQDVAASGPWGIVVSADKKIDPDARDEVEKAKRAGFDNAKIYNHQNWYRTVVEFSNFAEAQAALPQLRAIPNHGSAYLVNMGKWCPTRKDEGNGVLLCVLG